MLFIENRQGWSETTLHPCLFSVALSVLSWVNSYVIAYFSGYLLYFLMRSTGAMSLTGCAGSLTIRPSAVWRAFSRPWQSNIEDMQMQFSSWE